MLDCDSVGEISGSDGTNIQVTKTSGKSLLAIFEWRRSCVLETELGGIYRCVYDKNVSGVICSSQIKVLQHRVEHFSFHVIPGQ